MYPFVTGLVLPFVFGTPLVPLGFEPAMLQCVPSKRRERRVDEQVVEGDAVQIMPLAVNGKRTGMTVVR